jgi:SM-20-related protein
MADIFNKVAPYGVVRDWLGKQTVERLLRFIQSNEHLFKDSGVYSESGTQGIYNTDRVSKKMDLGNFKGELKASVLELLPVMFDRLGMERFAPGKIESECVAHGDGAFFVQHIDTHRFSEGHLRVISAVYYFHALPKAFSGGLLRLYSLDKGTHVDIPPDYDTIVFFPSFFPHEVLPVKCPSQRFLDSRFAVNFWINRN